jgi:pimeloyl-ACP methyl ester carboxylesterase
MIGVDGVAALAWKTRVQTFDSDGVRIAYLDQGAGRPILLIHGFASSMRFNWIDPGWVSLLVRNGFRIIAVDNRGHGASDKLYDPALYTGPQMAEDARRLLDHLGIEQADVMGYSMGARITAFLTLNHPARVHSAIFGGMGGNMLRPLGRTEEIAAALEAPSLDDVQDAFMRTYRVFADKTGADRRALAACIRAGREALSPAMLGNIRCPVLVAIGTEDIVSGTAEELASVIPGAETLAIPKRDHMLAVGDRVYKDGVLDFLRRHA